MNKATKYPIILVHGMGVRDLKHISSWGRVPKKLALEGYSVYRGEQDANGTAQDNAAALKSRITGILESTGAEKVNVIAHSKGGLDVRYMISHLDMGSKVASLTTVSTPHHGSKTMDVLLKIPAPLLRFGSWVTDLIMKLCGDKQPQTYKVLNSFSTTSAEAFNRETPDDDRVLYQSYGFYMKHWYSDLFMLLPYIVVYCIEGRNDGLLTPESMEWGNYKGAYCGNARRGISHCDTIDFRRHRFTAKQGDHISDIVQLYMGIAEELQKKGF